MERKPVRIRFRRWCPPSRRGTPLMWRIWTALTMCSPTNFPLWSLSGSRNDWPIPIRKDLDIREQHSNRLHIIYYINAKCNTRFHCWFDLRSLDWFNSYWWINLLLIPSSFFIHKIEYWAYQCIPYRDNNIGMKTNSNEMIADPIETWTR